MRNPPLGVLRTRPEEAVKSGLFSLRCAREWLHPVMLKASLEGTMDVTPLQDALATAEAEAERLKAVQK